MKSGEQDMFFGEEETFAGLVIKWYIHNLLVIINVADLLPRMKHEC
jgi:hypothetical protein